MGVMVILAFMVTSLPDVSEEELQAGAAAVVTASHNDPKSDEPFYKQYTAIFGFVAQFVRILQLLSTLRLAGFCIQMYVGAQVTVGMISLNGSYSDDYG
jgi:FHS family L-fucose permease-like MFS transporter